MQVLKFGGSSVAGSDVIKQVIQIVQQALQKDKTIVVVSALSGVTDTLIYCGKQAAEGSEQYAELLQSLEQRHLTTVRELLPVTQQSSVLSLVKTLCNELEDVCKGVFTLRELSPRTLDKITSYGELLSSQIIAAAFQHGGQLTQWADSRQLISTDNAFTHALVDFEKTNQQINDFVALHPHSLIVAPGFIASTSDESTTTLGRGGSDYTAAIFAAAVRAYTLEIWTDVSGMMTADPRLVNNHRPIPRISYQEAMELSHFGAKVIYPPTIQPVMGLGIPVWVKNTFAPGDAGTVIESNPTKDGDSITGISSIGGVALLSLEGSGMIGIPGFSKRFFEALAAQSINVILITQSSSEHSITVGIQEAFADKAKAAVDAAFAIEIASLKVAPLIVETSLSIVAVVGDSMKSHTGISGRLFGALGKNGINVRAIAQGSSERNISAVIATPDTKKALNVLHEAFFETTYKQLNLFVIGVGNVGGKLLAQLHQQKEYLLEHMRLQVRVAGIANSKKMLFSDEGIDLTKWQELLQETGETMDRDAFVERMLKKNLRNSVFADITANASIAEVYNRILQKSISIVACNKIACSSPYPYYQSLKQNAREYNADFLFETNVGAGLPVIGTLNDLLRSGDEISKIEAVLSGTLNFVFNNYNGTKSFAQVVQQAQDEGYTEPDPRLDLSGTDVMRKIMILARESGAKIEMDDITNTSFMPESCMTGSIENFYEQMEKEEAHFRSLYDAAVAAGNKLKFVARYEGGKATVGLQQIDPQSDFYHLYGKDNVVLFYTRRYPEQPLVIKGAGAGADVTASGVFADVIRAVKQL
jgi:aspartokinase/homoserine dehydrogenase 1